MKRDLILILSVFVLFACGAKEEKSEKKSYNFTTNGCSTGEHSYSSAEELCKALQDEKVNNGCSYEMRKKMFQENCSGEFTPTKLEPNLDNNSTSDIPPDIMDDNVVVEKPAFSDGQE
jgi:hypothetical protein